jgi:hypothetical protein
MYSTFHSRIIYVWEPLESIVMTGGESTAAAITAVMREGERVSCQPINAPFITAGVVCMHGVMHDVSWTHNPGMEQRTYT